MKKLFLALAIASGFAHAQPAGFTFLSDIQGGQAYIGNIRAQSLIADPSVKLAEYTMFSTQNGAFVNFVADCAKPDVTFVVRLDVNGNKHRSSPSITPQGTIGWMGNVYACATAYTWPETKPSKPKSNI